MTGTWATGWATGDIVTAAEFKKGAGSLSDTTAGGAVANIDISGIVATYAHLLISVYARSDTAATSTTLLLRFNGDSAANYDWQQLTGSAAAAGAAESFAASGAFVGNMPANTAGANLFSATEIFIPNYAGAVNNKQSVAINSSKIGTASGNFGVNALGGAWRSNAAINRVTLLPGAGNLVAGTRVTIYGFGA